MVTRSEVVKEQVQKLDKDTKDMLEELIAHAHGRSS